MYYCFWGIFFSRQGGPPPAVENQVSAMYSSPTKCFAWLLAGLLLLASPFALAANKESSLPPQYRQWLDRDVAYIITSQEKQDFLALTTDDARDKFIQQFWDIRNPSPGAPTNSYRDDIYARIAYANQHFGHEGWRTDMGRIYILFGPPQQHAIYRGQSNVRPMEIWFYSRPHPALPPFFSIVFYQRETGGDYRLYSPVMDGPDQLIAVTGAENNRVAAVQEIDRSLGREVARTTLSLLPDEPVDLAGATSSLSSDFMLATIRNLADSPANIQMLNERRRLLEAVTHRVVLGGEYLDVVTVPLLDHQGNTDLHYVLRLKRPEDFALQQSNDGRYYFSATVLARVSTPDKKLIFSQERKLNQYLTENQMEQVKNKVFGYEGVLPLPPGKYEIEFVLSNELKKTAFRDQKEVVVPAPPSSGFTLTSVVPFSDAAAQPDASDLQAFTAAGVKFTPLTGEGLNLVPGRDLQFFYQIWGPRADPKSYRDSKLSVTLFPYTTLFRSDRKSVV